MNIPDSNESIFTRKDYEQLLQAYEELLEKDAPLSAVAPIREILERVKPFFEKDGGRDKRF
jgi:hypothetical protein